MPKNVEKKAGDVWLVEAAKVERTDNPLNVPYDVALSEAASAAHFVTKYWKPEGNRPGLSRVQQRLPLKTADDVLALVGAVQAAQTRLIMLVDPVVADRGERARFIIGELESTLEFVLDDGVDEPADQKLAQIQAFHSQNGQRSSALVQSLRDHAALAAELKDHIGDIDDEFDSKLIGEAIKLADDISAHPVAAAPSSTEVTAATQTRNQLLHLLTGKVRLIRKTAAHVFRHSPEIVREVSSAYERRRRAAARRAKLAEEKEGKSPAGK